MFALVSLAYVARAQVQSRQDKAEALALETLKLEAAASGPTDLALFDAYKKLFDAWNVIADYPKARQAMERALAIAEANPAARDERLAQALLSLGTVLYQAGDFNAAVQHLRRAVTAWERAVGPDDLKVRGPYQNLCVVQINMGDYREARRNCLRALAIAEKHLGPDANITLSLVMNLGVVETSLFEYGEALKRQARVLAVRRAKLKPDHPNLGYTLANLGEAHEGLRQYGKARESYLEALSIFEKNKETEPRAIAYVTRSLGDIAAKTGNYAEAIERYTASLAIMRQLVGPSHPTVGEHLANLSSALRLAGRNEQAMHAALDSSRIRREHLSSVAAGSAERQALLFDSALAVGLHVALGLAAGKASTVELRKDAWNALIRDRALVLDEITVRNRSIRASGQETSKLAEEYAAARRELARLVIRGRGTNAAPFDSALHAARDQMESLERLLASASAEFRRTTERAHAGYTDVAEALTSSTALVAFAYYKPQQYAIPGTAIDPQSIEPRYLAFVKAGASPLPVAISLGPAALIDSLVGNWRKELRKEAESDGRSAARNEASYRAAGALLRQAIWDPIEPHVKTARRVFVVPDGSLQFVNFSALPRRAAGYLVEGGQSIHYLSAERDLVARAPESAGSGMLAIGNPFYDARPARAKPVTPVLRGNTTGCSDFDEVRFSALPASLQELNSILGIWNASGERTTVLSGAQATESAFKENAPGHRLIHLATHGFFLEDRCKGNSVLRESPLLRAGLALAGANLRRQAQAGEEDGILTAEEIATLDLSGADWVVLSGCETGLGEVKSGEGVLGLRRAVQAAGARTLITSLWPVEDEAARNWMAALYEERFARGFDTADAVRQASLRQLKARRSNGRTTHPFYWAGFIAVGDWR